MIRKNGKEIQSIFIGSTPITKITHNKIIVWSSHIPISDETSGHIIIPTEIDAKHI